MRLEDGNTSRFVTVREADGEDRQAGRKGKKRPENAQ